MEDNIVEFKCTPIRCVCDKPDFKIYGCDNVVSMDKEVKIKKNNYSNYTISGNLHDLGIGVEYKVKAREIYDSKYKYSYKVLEISRDIPTDAKATRLFLNEILSENQANVLINVYPDIVDRVMNDDLDDIDLSKTKGIKEKTFKNIKSKIFDNFTISVLFKEFGGLLEFPVLKKLSSKYPSAQKIKEALSDDPYECLCGLSRVAFKTADSILLTMEKKSKNSDENIGIDFGTDLRTSETRMKACIKFTIRTNESNGNTKMQLKTLKSNCNKLTPQCMDLFVPTLKEMKDVKITKDGYIANLYTFEKEAYASSKILSALETPILWSMDVDKYKETPEGNLTDEQLSMLKGIQLHNIYMLIGFSGCGKSFSTQQLIKMLDDNKKTYVIMAPTGRAAKVIGGYTNRESFTIHRGLAFNPSEGWFNDYKNKLNIDVVIVDESSMKDIELFYRLVDAIDFTRTKLLLIGDPAQLPSVGCGNVLHDLVNSKIIPMTMLTQVFRYGVGGLSTVATKIRNGEAYLPKLPTAPITIGEDKAFTFIPANDKSIVKNCIKLYKSLLKTYKPEDIMVLSSYNKGDYGTKALNNYLQRVANIENISEKNSIKYGEKAETTFYYNDIVIQKANNYKAEIFEKYNADSMFINEEPMVTFVANGETGKIEDIHGNKKECRISFDTNVRYDKELLKNVNLAYSLSVHSSQGGQAKVVIFLSPKSHAFMLNSNLIYVGVTRAKVRCFQIGDAGTSLKAIKKKENFNRDTNFSTLIHQKELCDKEYETFVAKYQKDDEDEFDEFEYAPW